MKLILPLSIIILLSACASVEKDVQPPIGSIAPDSNAAPGNPTAYARSLIGIPYKYGGNSPETGFDCSGFVGYVFSRSLGINLPHNTNEINRFGQAVEVDELRPGDLVFYNTLQRAFSHVGIYLGENRFVHAPSSGGNVRVDNMRELYWVHRFNGARRITSNH